MTEKRVAQLGPDELRDLVTKQPLSEKTALEVLRHPHCSAEIAEKIADERKVLASIGVRQLLCGTRGFPLSKAVNFLATLPWASLLELITLPATPPAVRRQAERKLLLKLPQLACGEKIAMARRSPRVLFKALISTGDDMILSALLNNGRLVENDILLMLSSAKLSPDLCRELASHRRWGPYRRIRKGMVVCQNTPYAVALSILVLLGTGEIKEVITHPNVSGEVKKAAQVLIEKRKHRK